MRWDAMCRVQPPILHLLCGKMAAGKSTLARELSCSTGALLLSEDDLLSKLYPGEISDIPAYVSSSNRLKAALEPIIIDLLRSGLTVVLDFPANTINQRSWLVGLAQQAGVPHQLHYIDCPDEVCREQLLERVSDNPGRVMTDTLEMFDAITRYFEPPTAEEGLNLRIIRRD